MVADCRFENLTQRNLKVTFALRKNVKSKRYNLDNSEQLLFSLRT